MAMKIAPFPFLLCVLLAPALAVAADGAGAGTARQPLNLTLPRDALSETWSPPATGMGSAMQLPDLGGPRLGHTGAARQGGGRSDLPYGAGYEARQNAGSGAGGGGHGRGRGRGR